MENYERLEKVGEGAPPRFPSLSLALNGTGLHCSSTFPYLARRHVWYRVQVQAGKRHFPDQCAVSKSGKDLHTVGSVPPVHALVSLPFSMLM